MNYNSTSHIGSVNRKPYAFSGGFTLLEVLVVVAILSIMMGIVIVAVNPTHQLSLARDSQRRSDIAQIHKAILQYFIDHQDYAVRVPTQDTVYEGCMLFNDNAARGCGAYVNMSDLVPDYVAALPQDPIMLKTSIGTGYNIAVNANTGVYVEAPNTEIGIGEEKTILHVGRPPMGYEIPRLIVQKAEPASFTERAKESIAIIEENSTDWFRIVGIASTIILILGYLIRRRMTRKYRGASSSLLN